MQPTQRYTLYILLLIAGAAWIILSAENINTPASGMFTAPQKGFSAPDITLGTIDGKIYTLSELQGKAVLVNLWATWCPPCRAEMPTIDKIYREYKDKGFVVLAVNATNQDASEAIAPFISQYNLTFPILLDVTGIVSADYQLQSLPSSYFIDRGGIIQDVVIGGPMSEVLLRTRVEQILK